ncbi:MAG: hypothetical protein IT305_31225 [Chloroflexi bacterium]|nr:hypothetical protein [Chloroflexota bacterium]
MHQGDRACHDAGTLRREVAGVRFDPAMTRDEILDALLAAARATWGDERLGELRATLELTAGAIWRIEREPLEPMDVEP